MDEESKRKYKEDFQRRAVAVAESVYTLRLSNPVDMDYKICCAAVDIATEQFPPDEEGNYSRAWKQVKDAFISIVEKVIEAKAQRKDIL